MHIYDDVIIIVGTQRPTACDDKRFCRDIRRLIASFRMYEQVL